MITAPSNIASPRLLAATGPRAIIPAPVRAAPITNRCPPVIARPRALTHRWRSSIRANLPRVVADRPDRPGERIVTSSLGIVLHDDAPGGEVNRRVGDTIHCLQNRLDLHGARRAMQARAAQDRLHRLLRDWPPFGGTVTITVLSSGHAQIDPDQAARAVSETDSEPRRGISEPGPETRRGTSG